MRQNGKKRKLQIKRGPNKKRICRCSESDEKLGLARLPIFFHCFKICNYWSEIFKSIAMFVWLFSIEVRNAVIYSESKKSTGGERKGGDSIMENYTYIYVYIYEQYVHRHCNMVESIFEHRFCAEKLFGFSMSDIPLTMRMQTEYSRALVYTMCPWARIRRWLSSRGWGCQIEYIKWDESQVHNQY